MYDVVVVGASVSGLRTAELISKKGFNVLVLEEHKSVGEPLKCAGLVSWRLTQLITDMPSDIIINKVGKARFFSTRNSFELKSKNPVYVIDRAKFDKYLYDRAKAAGAKVNLGERFKELKQQEDCLKIKTNKKSYETKILIGADGVNSTVAQKVGIEQPDNKLVALQTTVNGIFDPQIVELHFGSDYPGFFGCVVPESKGRARIGLATKYNTKEYFEKFLERRVDQNKEPDVAGLINFGLIESSVVDRILLVGDAACQVKPFSGGGIIYGLIGSGFCSLACIKALKESKFDKDFLEKQYDLKWKEKLEKPINKGLKYRKWSEMSDRKLNIIFSTGRTGLTKILGSFDMDLL